MEAGALVNEVAKNYSDPSPSLTLTLALTLTRCIELREAGRGRTRLRNYETFYGPLAPLVWLHRRAHIQEGFHAFNRDLGCLLAPRKCAASQHSRGSGS